MQKGFAPILILVGIVAIIGITSGAYYLGKSQTPKSQNQVVGSQTPQPTISAGNPAPTDTDETANWKTYTDSKKLYSFQYPADWEVLDKVPQNYRFMLFDPNIAGWKLEDWLKSKMFGDQCRGPILRNTRINTTIIAFEVIEKNSDGAFCWSSGEFTDTYKRTIKIFTPPQEVSVAKWRLGDYIFPITKDNSGQKYSPEWKGELFQQVWLPTQSSMYNAVVALVHKDKIDNTAEQVYDQILSTFRFDSLP